jgi:biopolymer transport protein ExbD
VILGGKLQSMGLRDVQLSRMRTRYAARFTPGGGVLGMAPWLDLVLVFIFYLLLETRVTLHPGIVVELPQAPFADGVQTGDVALLTMERGVDGILREVAYVDELRYVLASDHEALAKALVTLRGEASKAMMLYADRRVPHASVAGMLELARLAGFEEVGLATRMPQQSAATAAPMNAGMAN